MRIANEDNAPEKDVKKQNGNERCTHTHKTAKGKKTSGIS